MHSRTHDRAAGTESFGFPGESERWSLIWFLMILIFDLDTEFTTKSMIRVLKLV